MVYEEITDPFRRLVRIMERLQEPGGCAWDLEQTHESLKPYLIEEAYEALDAIDRQDYPHLVEELGDVLLQVVFHSVLAARFSRFRIDDVIRGAAEKMVRRHPHVFGEAEADTAKDVIKNWEKLKAEERKAKAKGPDDREDDFSSSIPESIFKNIPSHLPSLLKAQRMQEKAARVGFSFPTAAAAIAKVEEELGELKRELKENDKIRGRREFGDLVFSIVNLARYLDADAEEETRQTCEKFRRRFQAIERWAHEAGRELSDMSLEEMDGLWMRAKSEEQL